MANNNKPNIIFRFHALSRMFERQISEMDVMYVLSDGKIIEDYPNDKPYPSCLKLGFVRYCGEEYLSQEISAYLFKLAEEAVLAGVQIDVRKYKTAQMPQVSMPLS